MIRKVIVPALLVGACTAGYGLAGGNLPLPAIGSCKIKGNVSVNTGERIYHVPGQKRYRETVIRSEHGERWFCSEGEARAAGWRKSRV